MSFCWRPVFLNMPIASIRHFMIPRCPEIRTFALRCLSTHSFQIQKQLLCVHRNFKARKSCSGLLHLSSPLTYSYLEINDQNQQGKKVGFLKSHGKRKDWLKSGELIETVISNKGDEAWMPEDWSGLAEKLLQLDTGSWEIMCIIYLYNTSNVTLGQSLMKFLMSQPGKPPQLFFTYFISLLGKECNGDAALEEKMKQLYDELMSKCDVLDSLSMELLTRGLCQTKHYMECLYLLMKAKETNTQSHLILFNTFIGGLMNKDHDLCTFVLSHFDDPSTSAIFIQQLQQVVDAALKCDNKEGLRLFFNFLQKQGLTPKKDTILGLVDSLERYEPGQWQGNFGQVQYTSGRCSVCGHAMEEEILTDEEFKSIQSAFLDQVIVSENIFYKTSPAEVKSFISFVNQKGPFDVVIDGLNVLFVTNGRKRQKSPDPLMLSVIESYFSRQGLKVLILGSKFLEIILRKMTYDSDVYICSTTKADDAFFLYAALHSGKETLIISADKLRDHKHRLEPKLRPIFHRWLKSAQVFDFFTHYRTDNMILKRRNFNLGPVEDKAGWHLPFDDTTNFLSFGKNGVMCLRHGPENFVSLKNNSFRKKRDFSRNKRQKSNSREWYEL